MNTFRAFEARERGEQRKKNFLLTVIFVALMVAILVVVYMKLNALPFKGSDIKIAVIAKGGGNPWSMEFLTAAKQEAESMGITVHMFTAIHDQANFHNMLVQAGDKGYDGIIAMGAFGKESVDDIKKLADKGIPIVTFVSDPELSKVEGVTGTSQGRLQMEKLLLGNMNEQLKSKGNILYLWTSGDPELIECNKIYEQFLKDNPGIKELERFGTNAVGIGGSNIHSGQTVQARDAVAAMLKKHEKGKVDAIFATWGCFSMGAIQAIREAGRNEIKIYGYGAMNPHLQIMQEDNSPWVSTIAVNPREIGMVNARLLLKKIAKEETPAEYVFKPVLITQEQLRSIKEEVHTNNLDKVVGGWGDNKDFEEDWMRELRKHKRASAST